MAASAQPEIGPSAAITPQKRITWNHLPEEMKKNLKDEQLRCLAFSTAEYRVKSAQVQTFNLGSRTAGQLAFAGLDRALGSRWAAFGAMGAINQETRNNFRTDVQLRLIKEAQSETVFIARTLPFELTLSIEPGDEITLFFALGGLRQPYASDDFSLGEWTPFLATNALTKQHIPLAPLPLASPPDVCNRKNRSADGWTLWGILLILSVGFIGYCVATANGDPATEGCLIFWGVVGFFLLCSGFGELAKRAEKTRKTVEWQNQLDIAGQTAREHPV